MKVVIQIPCFNEEKTLELVYKDLPKKIDKVDEIEYQIIDDGSTDRTVEVAKELGFHRIVKSARHNKRKLGLAFKAGVEAALKAGADILVNTDGDNQYPGDMIPELVRVIIENKADIAIGDRNPGKFEEFSRVKRCLQRLGSNTIAFLTKEDIRDAVSGFRAYSREALEKIHVMTDYTYTVDTLIQATTKGLDIEWVDIKPNAKTRESRLIKSLFSKVRKSGTTILRMVTLYQPFRVFMFLTALFLLPGLFLVLRFLFLYVVRGGFSGYIQSVVIGGVFVTIAAQMFALGIIADLLSANRFFLEEVLTKMKKNENKNEKQD